MKRTMSTSAFIRTAEEKIGNVLSRHNIAPKFCSFNQESPSRYATFKVGQTPCSVGIYDDDITLTCGERDEQLFECYLTAEWSSDVALIESFARRLDRFLSGGPWDEPEEGELGPIARLAKKLGKALRK